MVQKYFNHFYNLSGNFFQYDVINNKQLENDTRAHYDKRVRAARRACTRYT